MVTSKGYAPVGHSKPTDALLIITARACRQLGMHAAASNMPLFLQSRGYSVFEMGVALSSGLAGATAFTFLAPNLKAVARGHCLQLFSCAMCVGVLVIAIVPNHHILAMCAVLALSGLSLHPAVSPQIPLELSHLRAAFASSGASSEEQWFWLSLYRTVNTLAASAGALAQTIPVWLALPASHWMVFVGAAISHAASIVLYQRLRLDDTPWYAKDESSGIAAYGAVASQALTPSLPTMVVTAPQTPPPPPLACLLAARRLPRHYQMICALFALEAFAMGMIVPALGAFWMHGRYQLDVRIMGPVTAAFFFLATFSLVIAPFVIERVGTRATLLLPHTLSSVALIALPFCPSIGSAVAIWLCRAALSQMDVPARDWFMDNALKGEYFISAKGAIAPARGLATVFGPLASCALWSMWGPESTFVVAGVCLVIYDCMVLKISCEFE